MRAAQVLITCLIAAAHGYPAAQSGSGSAFDPEDPLTRQAGSTFDPEDPLTRQVRESLNIAENMNVLELCNSAPNSEGQQTGPEGPLNLALKPGIYKNSLSSKPV